MLSTAIWALEDGSRSLRALQLEFGAARDDGVAVLDEGCSSSTR